MRWGLKSKEALAITLLTLVVVATTLVVHLAQLTRVTVEETQRQVGRRRRRQANARNHVDAVLPSALAGEPLRTNECRACLLPKHSDIRAPDSRQRYDGRSAFHEFCIERSPSPHDPSTD